MWKKISRFGKKLVENGLVDSNFGNISVRSSSKMIITTSGAKLDEITGISVVELDIDRRSEVDDIASSETIVHRSIYMNTPALAIIHVHPFFSVIESLLTENDSIIPMNIEGEYFLHEIPVVRGGAGTSELGKKVAEVLKDHKGLIVYGHGTFAIGKDLEEAYFITTQIEHSCKFKYFFELARK